LESALPGTVAAIPGVAPAPAVILAGIQEQPSAAALGPALSVVWILLSPVSRLRRPPASGRVDGSPVPDEALASDQV
jgi:hypothetical protein